MLWSCCFAVLEYPASVSLSLTFNQFFAWSTVQQGTFSSSNCKCKQLISGFWGEQIGRQMHFGDRGTGGVKPHQSHANLSCLILGPHVEYNRKGLGGVLTCTLLVQPPKVSFLCCPPCSFHPLFPQCFKSCHFKLSQRPPMAGSSLAVVEAVAAVGGGPGRDGHGHVCGVLPIRPALAVPTHPTLMAASKHCVVIRTTG